MVINHKQRQQFCILVSHDSERVCVFGSVCSWVSAVRVEHWVSVVCICMCLLYSCVTRMCCVCVFMCLLFVFVCVTGMYVCLEWSIGTMNVCVGSCMYVSRECLPNSFTLYKSDTTILSLSHNISHFSPFSFSITIHTSNTTKLSPSHNISHFKPSSFSIILLIESNSYVSPQYII